MPKFIGPLIMGGKKCAACGKDLEIGERVVAEGTFHLKWYHLACYKK